MYDDGYFNQLEHASVQRFLMSYQADRNETTYYDHNAHVMYAAQDQQYVDIEMIIKVPH